LVALIIPYLLIGVISAGVVMQSMTGGAFSTIFQTSNPATSGGIPPWLGSLIICVVVLIYVFFGGMRGTAWANAFQTMVFMILGVVTFFVIAQKLGRQDTIWESIQVASQAVEPDKATRIEMSKTKFFTYLLVPLSVGMFPHIFQHWLTARSASSFKLAIVAHPIFIMIVWVPCVLIGMWATTELVPSEPPLPKIPGTDLVNANAILPFLVKTQTGAILGGLLTAGILAAIMSSLDSQFLCLGSIFENDLVAHYLGKDRFTNKQQVLITRGFIILIVAITYALSLFNPTSVFALGVWCFSGFSSLFPLVFAAIYWRRLTAAGAYAAIIGTVVSWGYLFYQSDYGANGSYTVDFTIGGSTYETLPVLAIFLTSLISMVAVSLITKPPREEVIGRFFEAEIFED
jgi:solute:Na+ symporter, SSS family